jgi:lipid-A-disaccharide synthase
MILAGEVSGDMHAAALVREIAARSPGARFSGIGGPLMRAAGVETQCDVADLAVMGVSEVLLRLPFFRRLFRELLDKARRERPDAVILVDYPGFNLRFAKAAHDIGLKTVYYICPKVWAWNRGRIPKLVAAVDRLLAVFPFEPALFEGTGLRVDFVGNPLVDRTRTPSDPIPLPWNGDPRIALLPGSREHEVRRILPVLAAAGARIETDRPRAAFIVPAPNPAIADRDSRVLAGATPRPTRCAVVSGRTYDVLRQARAAMVASGTATLEAGLLRCPMVITYRTSAFTAMMARRLLRIPYVGLVNILSNRFVCPELLQENATPEKLAAATLPLLDETPEQTTMLEALDAITRSLGPPGAAARAAEIVLQD